MLKIECARRTVWTKIPRMGRFGQILVGFSSNSPHKINIFPNGQRFSWESLGRSHPPPNIDWRPISGCSFTRYRVRKLHPAVSGWGSPRGLAFGKIRWLIWLWWDRKTLKSVRIIPCDGFHASLAPPNARWVQRTNTPPKNVTSLL